MKTIRLLFLFALMAGIYLPARAATPIGVKGILITASNDKGASDQRLGSYEANLKRILRFESFRYLGEDSATVNVPGSGDLSLGNGQQVSLSTESADGKTVLLKVRWGSVRHEYVVQRGSTTVLGGPSTGKKGEVYAVILIGK